MATDSSFLAWKIECAEELGGLHSMRSQRVRHDLATKKTKTRFIFFTVEVKENRKAFKRKIRIYFNPTIQLRSL